jgi:hypothetical protein
MIFSMEQERKAGIMVPPNMKVISSKEKNTERVNSHGKMEVIMKATLLMVNLKVMVNNNIPFTNFIYFRKVLFC